jgi:hypothetical protein
MQGRAATIRCDRRLVSRLSREPRKLPIRAVRRRYSLTSASAIFWEI